MFLIYCIYSFACIMGGAFCIFFAAQLIAALTEPNMVYYLCLFDKYVARCYSLLWVYLQHFRNQVSDCFTSRWGKLVFRIIWIPDFFKELLISCTPKRKYAGKWDKKQNSKSPYICSFSPILFALDNFRSHIAWCTTEYFDFIGSFNTCTKPKINQFWT
jgi:hypothetical protein